jgi:5-methylcytosine-specific restriction endonuclease McrA
MPAKRYFAGKSRDSWSQMNLIDQLVMKVKLANRDGCLCCTKHGHGCGANLNIKKLTLDHIIPISAGGPVSDIGNMQLLCRRCHAKKTEMEQW